MKSTLVSILVAALLWASLPDTPARADSSDGAAISIGVLALVVGAYCLVALRSDVERYSQAEKQEMIAEAVRKAEEAPIVLQAITDPVAFGSTEMDSSSGRIAGASLGWRVHF